MTILQLDDAMVLRCVHMAQEALTQAQVALREARERGSPIDRSVAGHLANAQESVSTCRRRVEQTARREAPIPQPS